MFRSFAQKGFKVTFQNGFTVSVMFGVGNYCEHRFNREVEPMGNLVEVRSEHNAVDAEIAVFDPNNNYRNDFPGCSKTEPVVGWITPEQMLEVMNWAASQTV